MLDRLNHHLISHLGIHSKNAFLLAVSGGVDSMFLWHAFRKLKLNYAIAHCNFGLRGKDSKKDEAFVKAFGKKKEKVFIRKFNTLEYASENKLSIQMAARELRYRYFQELQIENGFDYIVTAHHSDDVVEGLFIQLLRNTEPWDLHSIPEKSGHLLRPLLIFNKEEIVKYCKVNDINFRDDKSNSGDDYLRNRIRHHVIPAFEKVMPDFRESISEFLENADLLSSSFDNFFQKTLNEISVLKDNEVRIPLNELRNLPFQNIFLSKFLRKFGFSRKLVSPVKTALNSQPGKQFFSATHCILIDRTDLIVSPAGRSDNETLEFSIAELAENKTPFVKAEVFLRDQAFEPYDSGGRIYLDFELLHEPIIFRSWQKGDWFIPFGMKGRKKLSDFFTDIKFSKSDKSRVRIMTSGGSICWILGTRIDNRFRISDKTRRIISLEII